MTTCYRTFVLECLVLLAVTRSARVSDYFLTAGAEFEKATVKLSCFFQFLTLTLKNFGSFTDGYSNFWLSLT